MAYSLSELHENGVPRLLEQIDSLEQWQRKREYIQSVWLEYIGGIPARQPVVWTECSSEHLEGHVRKHIRYSTAYKDEVTAFLLIPDGIAEDASASCSAILALHPTHAEGKRDTGTSEGRVNRQYGLELVMRGHIVLVPDTITAGERIYTEPFMTAPFYGRHPKWTAVGKMIVDHMYGVDLLCQLPQVDPNRIGAIGHSLGGYNSFFLAGADTRIRAFVSSCGFSTFSGDPVPHRWGLRDWFSHIPRLTPDINQGFVPFEFNEIAALAAHTPALFWSGQQDRIFPNWQRISEAMQDVKSLYNWLGCGDRFTYVMGTEEHDFPPYIRELAYRFLDRWLKPQVEGD